MAEYENLKTTFNPKGFNPDKWASAAAYAGMKYVVFTTKHHDGFCMFHSQFTDYKITDPACPFSTNPKANIAKEIFDAFRQQGLWAGAYFSKPDWHHPDYWSPYYPPRDRNVNYEPEANPEKWERFTQFTHNQIFELLTNYGKIDILWLENSGAKYAVITTKHHDGVALWDSKSANLNVVDKSPAQRDLIVPFAKAIRNQGLKPGFYYSLLDWSHPDYPNFTRDKKRYEQDSVRWQRFVDFNFAQLAELSEYHPDLYWFDGDWEQTAQQWKAKEIRDFVLGKTPTTIINSRLQGYGDYATPEQGVPISRPQAEYWELCLTMNNS